MATTGTVTDVSVKQSVILLELLVGEWGRAEGGAYYITEELWQQRCFSVDMDVAARHQGHCRSIYSPHYQVGHEHLSRLHFCFLLCAFDGSDPEAAACLCTDNVCFCAAACMLWKRHSWWHETRRDGCECECDTRHWLINYWHLLPMWRVTHAVWSVRGLKEKRTVCPRWRRL